MEQRVLEYNHMYVAMGFQQVYYGVSLEKVLSTNGAGKMSTRVQKRRRRRRMNLYSFLNHIQNLTQNDDRLKDKSKSDKICRGRERKKSCDPGLSKAILGRIHRDKSIKKKEKNYLDFIKIKNVCSMKDIVKGMNRQVKD